MTTFDTSLLPPKETEQPVVLFRPVWRPVVTETLILIAGTLLVVLAGGALGLELDGDRRTLFTAGLALVPLGLWFLFSWRLERRAQQPRGKLIPVLAVSLLVANGLVAPFIEDYIEPDRWLNTLGGLTRIFAYAISVGLATETGKYLVLRTMVSPRLLRRRGDIVVYSLLISLAFATVFNLRFALFEGGAQPGPAAIRVLGFVLAQEGIGLVVAYRLMNMWFGQTPVYALALNLVLGSLLHGVFIAMRAGFVVQGFGIGETANSPLMGLVFSIGFGVVLFVVHAFVISNAEARDSRRVGGEV